VRQVFSHFILIRMAEAEERKWQLSAACHPHRKKSDQQAAWAAAADIATVGRVRKSAYEMVDETTRIEMIGSALKLHGQAWAARHARHMSWLAAMGITPGEAIARHNAWLEQEMQNPFWRHNRDGGKHGDSDA
jgi:hypothetical protein